MVPLKFRAAGRGPATCRNSFDIGLVLCSLHEDSDESATLLKRLIDRGHREHWLFAYFARVNLSHVPTALLMLCLTTDMLQKQDRKLLQAAELALALGQKWHKHHPWLQFQSASHEQHPRTMYAKYQRMCVTQRQPPYPRTRSSRKVAAATLQHGGRPYQLGSLAHGLAGSSCRGERRMVMHRHMHTQLLYAACCHTQSSKSATCWQGDDGMS